MNSEISDSKPQQSESEDVGSLLVDEIVQWVAKAIIEGHLAPGADLNSVELARRFHTSRTPVREALLILSREGLVEWSPRRRPRVSALTLKEVRELYQLRATLFSMVAVSIVEQATEAQLAELWQVQAELAAAAAEGDVDRYFWANVAFRDKELLLSNNAVIKQVLDSLRLRTHRLRHLSASLPGRLQRSCADHERLCQAYSDRDATLASALNRSLVMSALQGVEQAWGEPPVAGRHGETW